MIHVLRIVIIMVVWLFSCFVVENVLNMKTPAYIMLAGFISGLIAIRISEIW